MRHRVFGALLACCMAVTAAAPAAWAESAGETRTVPAPPDRVIIENAAAPGGERARLFAAEETADFTSFHDQLEEKARTLYDALATDESVETIRRGEDVTLYQLDATYYNFVAQQSTVIDHFYVVPDALGAFGRDHPEVFWTVGASYGLTTYEKAVNGALIPVAEDEDGTFSINSRKNYVIRLELTLPIAYPWSGDASITEDEALMNAQIQSIVSGLTGTTRYDKLLQVHNWLTKNNLYNDMVNVTGEGEEDRSPWTPCAGLLDKYIPVCEGYARAFKLICDQLGIPCVLVNGTGYNNTDDSEPHMWNYVQMDDGCWYAVDATWDDPTTALNRVNSGAETTNFFLVGADTMVRGVSFVNSHDSNTNWLAGGNYDFRYPVLNRTAYDPTTARPEYLEVTFTYRTDTNTMTLVGSVPDGYAAFLAAYDSDGRLVLIDSPVTGTAVQIPADAVRPVQVFLVDAYTRVPCKQIGGGGGSGSGSTVSKMTFQFEAAD